MSQATVTSRGWGWAAHLRAGGTTPWAEWVGGPVEPGGRTLPGGEQLELLRRLNLVGRPGPALVRRVLTTSAPGRGRRGLPLPGDGAPPAYGVGPVDPGSLPAEELLRTAALLLAEDLVAADAAGQTQPDPTPGRRRRLRHRYRLAGDRWATGPLRDELVRRGHPQGGREHVVYVVGRPLDLLLADVWTARCFGQAPVAWPAWLAQARHRGSLGPRTDLLRVARQWRDRVGPERVQIVLDTSLLPALLRVRRLPAAVVSPPALSADAVELARQVGPTLGLLVAPEEKERLLRRGLRPRLVAAAPARPSRPPLGVPSEHLDWLREQARRQRDGLRADGYAVHGDLDQLLPAETGDPAGLPDVDRVLTLALRLLAERGGRA